MALPDLEGRSRAFEHACNCCVLIAPNYPRFVECVEERVLLDAFFESTADDQAEDRSD